MRKSEIKFHCGVVSKKEDKDVLEIVYYDEEPFKFKFQTSRGDSVFLTRESANEIIAFLQTEDSFSNEQISNMLTKVKQLEDRIAYLERFEPVQVSATISSEEAW